MLSAINGKAMTAYLTSEEALERKMTALVIGNAAYSGDDELANPAHDALDMAAKLNQYGFDVSVITDASHKDMDKALQTFRGELQTSDVGLFFFAGHGMQIDGVNYLLALDTPMNDETDAKHGALSLDKVIDTLDKSKVSTKIVMLDACRSNPWKRAWQRSAATLGLAPVYAPKGTIIGFATSPGQVAYDGKGRNGVYTGAILQHIDEPDLLIETVFKRVRNTVAAATKGKQITWEHTSLSGNFAFNLSLGSIISTYGPDALADAHFVLDTAKKSHRVIEGLRSHNWFAQNDAVTTFMAASVDKMADDNLFVVGRNIYQAACGGSRLAQAYVKNFIERAAKFPKEKRKALLDGMLFEVFFGPDAKPRAEIKADFFGELFALHSRKDLRESFDFIRNALVAAKAPLYAMPGTADVVPVTVTAKTLVEGYLVEAVYVGGVDVLRVDDDDEEGHVIYGRKSIEDFETLLSHQMKLPASQLKIAYAPPEAKKAEYLRLRMGATVSKG